MGAHSPAQPASATPAPGLVGGVSGEPAWVFLGSTYLLANPRTQLKGWGPHYLYMATLVSVIDIVIISVDTCCRNSGRYIIMLRLLSEYLYSH